MTWRYRPGSKEHYVEFDCGLGLRLYREHTHPNEWCWRLVGERDWEANRTFTDNVVDAKRIAHRGADLKLRLAIEQNSAELILVGTGMIT